MADVVLACGSDGVLYVGYDKHVSCIQGDELFVIECCQVVRCMDVHSNWLIVGGDDKVIQLFQRTEEGLSHKLVTTSDGKNNKKVVSLCCTNDGKTLIYGDRTGDVYSCSLPDMQAKRYLMGHLAILSTVALTSCNSYIITADCDEKIRVTNYPTTYEIEAFGLAHTGAVTTMTLLRNQPTTTATTASENSGGAVCDDVLVTGAADGSLKLWKLPTAECLATLQLQDSSSTATTTTTAGGGGGEGIVVGTAVVYLSGGSGGGGGGGGGPPLLPVVVSALHTDRSLVRLAALSSSQLSVCGSADGCVPLGVEDAQVLAVVGASNTNNAQQVVIAIDKHPFLLTLQLNQTEQGVEAKVDTTQFAAVQGKEAFKTSVCFEQAKPATVAELTAKKQKREEVAEKIRNEKSKSTEKEKGK
eukprot:TRINITY_DN65850_c1_g1_i2.p1 TRINITY_DN65850_c1_g1~~TRINITY_DN65850_c1_g1_i2.p1  ORF type:complete len:415 (+),score=74.45 TRINITY_DN65850_c1_g1_i2:48-1292(+)